MSTIRRAVASCTVCLGILLLISLPVGGGEYGSPTAPLLAYVGPGAGLGLLGSLLAILTVVILGLVGLLIYPVKLILRLRRNSSKSEAAEVVPSASTDP